MNKYLFVFSYIGTHFRGIQKNKNAFNNSVVNHLERALLSLSPLNTAKVINSSRTDKGVHALYSTFHCDLHLPSKIGLEINAVKEDHIVSTLNNFFSSSALDIRINKVVEVSDDFHCRHCVSQRTYIYRILQFPKQFHPSLVPSVELNRITVIRGDLDIDLIKKGCELFKGTHDFRYYSKLTDADEPIHTERTINVCKFEQVLPSLNYSNSLTNTADFKYWNFTISSKAFLRNQIRRMVSVLLGLGQGRFTLRELKSTFVYPLQPWKDSCNVAPPEGLYLVKIEYPENVVDLREK